MKRSGLAARLAFYCRSDEATIGPLSGMAERSEGIEKLLCPVNAGSEDRLRELLRCDRPSVTAT